ncbi:MAG: FAD-dependent oxidoreductase [Clostridiales bacterium]|jgi:protoporphyrinogen oxidase|nr:FAD-dependent oxidoreductase [Clostridiales bacterium]
MNKSVCIIGAGLSGLTCGARLAGAGFDVIVLEENTSPGGLLSVTRIGNEYLELVPHHLRKSDKALLQLTRDMKVSNKIEWFDSTWYGKAAHRKVGYFTEGFVCLTRSLMQEITDNGGRLMFSETVTEIQKTEDGKFNTVCVMPDSTVHNHASDIVIFTGSTRTFANVSHGLFLDMDIRDSIMDITYTASITAMLVLKKKYSEVYYQSVHNRDDIPFSRIVNHSNCFGARGYGGNVVYLTGECLVSDPIWIEDDASILSDFFAGFRHLYPNIRKSDIKAWRVTKTRYAGFGKYPPQDLTCPTEGLYVCASALSKFGTDEEPANRMDPTVNLANGICSRIIEKYCNEEDWLTDSIVTPITGAETPVTEGDIS